MKLNAELLTDAPYKVKVSSVEGFYEFVTDYGVRYRVGFMTDDIIQSASSYEFFIANVNCKSSPGDVKVRETILVILDAFFRCNNDVLLYICETADGKQVMRNRLFQSWFSMYQRKSMVTVLSSSVKDAEGVVNYATIIIRNDNSKLKEVIEEFTNTIMMLSVKPE